VQVEPLKPKLKPSGTKHLKVKFDNLLSTSDFKFNLRCYILDGVLALTSGPRPAALPALASDAESPEDGKWPDLITSAAAGDYGDDYFEVGRCRLTLRTPR
jgi:hypothetical protein